MADVKRFARYALVVEGFTGDEWSDHVQECRYGCARCDAYRCEATVEVRYAYNAVRGDLARPERAHYRCRFLRGGVGWLTCGVPVHRRQDPIPRWPWRDAAWGLIAVGYAATRSA